jgi:hypothetical protein
MESKHSSKNEWNGREGERKGEEKEEVRRGKGGKEGKWGEEKDFHMCVFDPIIKQFFSF